MTVVASLPAVGKVYELQDPDSPIRARLIDYGATVTHLLVPDREGHLKDVLLGCPRLEDYAKPHPFFNCLVGRYANRITNATFNLEGVQYDLAGNMGKHHIHGGPKGFANRTWSGVEVTNGVKFQLISTDGEEGYPGDVSVKAVYTLTNRTLKLKVEANTTKTTPISITAHHYFNLSGIQGSSVRDHFVQINADAYTPAADDLSQLGLIATVKGTPFDFRTRKQLRDEDALGSAHSQVLIAGGFDHNFVLNDRLVRPVAEVQDESTGISMTVRTDQPCMQFYTANTLKASGKDGVEYSPHQGICLETQQYPDSLNHAAYPNSLLKPGDLFQATTEYVFPMTESGI